MCSAAERLQAVCLTFAFRLSSGYGAVRTRYADASGTNANRVKDYVTNDPFSLREARNLRGP